MGEGGGRQHKGAAPANPDRSAHVDGPQLVPGSVGDDRSWPLSDPMRIVRRERQQAAAQISRSLKVWRTAKSGGYGQLLQNLEAKKIASTGDQPLEVPKKGPDGKDLPVEHGHGHKDHGYQTSMAEQKHRIETGETPSGRLQEDGKPPKAPGAASRFFSAEYEAEALTLARGEFPAILSHKLGKKVKPGRITFTVQTKRKEGFGNRAILDPAGPPGQRKAIEDGSLLRYALFIYAPVKGSGDGTKPEDWAPVTYYPVEKEKKA